MIMILINNLYFNFILDISYFKSSSKYGSFLCVISSRIFSADKDIIATTFAMTIPINDEYTLLLSSFLSMYTIPNESLLLYLFVMYSSVNNNAFKNKNDNNVKISIVNRNVSGVNMESLVVIVDKMICFSEKMSQ